jgi:DNA polymerase V
MMNEPKPQKTTGFASPAQGYEAKSFDFNEILVKKPHATFIFRQKSGEMAYRGIFNGSLLIVDRSARVISGSVVIIAYEGDFLCREVRFKNKTAIFTSSEREFHAGPDEYRIFGVVKNIVTEL